MFSYIRKLSISLLITALLCSSVIAQSAPPADPAALAGTKQMAGRTVDPDLNLTFDYETFYFTVLNGQKSREGYPIYAMECQFNGNRQCYGETGQPLGTIAEVASDMTHVGNRDVLRPDWKCDMICRDGQGRIVGAVSPAMRQWLRQQRKTK